MRLTMLVLVFTALFASTRAFAHHGFAVTYFADQTIKLEGRIVAVQFRNPHTFIHVAVENEKGEIQEWSAEWGPALQLSKFGVTSDTFKYGDVVSITGNPGRIPEDLRIRVRTVRRKSDGYVWGDKPDEVLN